MSIAKWYWCSTCHKPHKTDEGCPVPEAYALTEKEDDPRIQK
jgi:hypothetical protein